MAAQPSIPISHMLLGFVPWILVVGYITYRGYDKTASVEDMAVAKGHWGPVVLGFSAAATMQSAATILGVPGLVYGAGGFPGLWILITKSTAFGFGVLLFAKVFQHMGSRFGSLSVPDWLGHMYESDAVRVAGALLVTFQIAWIIAQLAGASQIISGLTVIPYNTALVIALVITFSYVFIGGESAVQTTDFFQGILMIVVVLLAVASGAWIIKGGFAGVPSAVASQGGNMGLFSPDFPIFAGPLAIFSFFMFFFAMSVSAPVGKKFLSLDSRKDIKVFVATVIVVTSIMDLTAFTGLYAYSLFPGLEMADQSIIRVIAMAFPSLVVSLMAVAIFSATVSTIDSVVIAITVSYTNDIYRRVLAKRGIVHADKTEEEINNFTIWLSRGFILLLAFISGIFAMTPPDFINVFVTVGNFGFISSVFPVILFGAVWERANSTGAIATLVIGPLIYVTLFLTQFPNNPFIAGTITMVFTMSIMGIVSAVTSGTPTRALTRSPEAEPAGD